MDHSNPDAQTERHGAQYEARVRFCVPIDATDDQISEFLEYELGFGDIGPENPLYNTSGVNRAEVRDIRPTGYALVTYWNAQDEEGRRIGRTRTERVSS